MNLRTDLAVERHELVGSGDIDGVELNKYDDGGVTVTQIRVLNENGSRSLGKPKGTYITVDVTPFSKASDLFSHQLTVLAKNIKKLLPEGSGTVLVAGLGNKSITSDALGPMAAELIFSTRHIGAELRKSIGMENIRSVAGIVPGVLGKTGIETGEIIESVVKKIKPCAVIAIDALASRRLERLGTTVQMASSGVVPGSGVGNARSRIDEQTLGVPVISIGVPTMVDAATLASDLIEQAGYASDAAAFQKLLKPIGEQIMVTPKEIDLMIERASQLVAMGINCALQPELDPKDILAIVS
ncbi:MAG: GPR endopeptidase [Acutalibacteraceae bacterium]